MNALSRALIIKSNGEMLSTGLGDASRGDRVDIEREGPRKLDSSASFMPKGASQHDAEPRVCRVLKRTRAMNLACRNNEANTRPPVG